MVLDGQCIPPQDGSKMAPKLKADLILLLPFNIMLLMSFILELLLMYAWKGFLGVGILCAFDKLKNFTNSQIIVK